MYQKCIIWGAGHYGKRIMGMLAEEKKYDIIAFCDMNEDLLCEKVGDYEIISIDKAVEICRCNEEIIIIIGIFNYEIIKEVKAIIEKKFPENTKTEIGHDIQDAVENRMLDKYHQNMTFHWEIDLERYFLQWLENIMSEVEYWVKDVASPLGERRGYNIKCRENNKFIHTDILQRVKANDVILDIGCGLMSKFGEMLDNGATIKLIPVDALAHFYNRINGRFQDGLKKNYVCQFGLFEFLGNHFEKNSADYIIIENALDHCIDPWRSLVESLYVLKRDGVMFLDHRRAEAVYENWTGLHKWNIDWIDGDLIIWNTENAINISESLQEYADVYVKYNKTMSVRECQNIRVEIVKKEDFELEDFFDMRKENIILVRCLNKLMEKLSSDSKIFGDMLKQSGL